MAIDPRVVASLYCRGEEMGDLTLSVPSWNLAFFYLDHGYARGLVRWGRIVDVAEDVRALGDASVARMELVV